LYFLFFCICFYDILCYCLSVYESDPVNIFNNNVIIIRALLLFKRKMMKNCVWPNWFTRGCV